MRREPLCPGGHLPALLAGTRALPGDNPPGFIDDSNDGSGRFDICLADVYLFTEPLAGSLGDVWRRGLARVCELVALTCTGDGTAIPWGRSTGALGVAMTIELASIGLACGLFDAATAAAWRQRLGEACRQPPD